MIRIKGFRKWYVWREGFLKNFEILNKYKGRMIWLFMGVIFIELIIEVGII